MVIFLFKCLKIRTCVIKLFSFFQTLIEKFLSQCLQLKVNPQNIILNTQKMTQKKMIHWSKNTKILWRNFVN